MPLRFLRDILFNDSQSDIPDVKSMQQQLKSCSIFTIIETPLRHPFEIFVRETIYYTLVAFLVTLLLLWILIPFLDNALASLQDYPLPVKALKDFLHSVKG